jgi:hypothetical protein
MESLVMESEKRSTEAAANVQKAITDLNVAIGSFPQRVADDLAAVYKEFYAQRSFVHQSAEELRRIFVSGSQTAARFPQWARRFSQLNADIGRGNADDEKPEQTYAQASSLVVDLERAVTDGRKVVVSLTTLIENARAIASDLKLLPPTGQPQAVLKEREMILAKYDNLQKGIAATTSQATKIMAFIQQETTKIGSQYSNQTRAALDGIKARQQCYDNWRLVIMEIKSAIGTA